MSYQNFKSSSLSHTQLSPVQGAPGHPAAVSSGTREHAGDSGETPLAFEDSQATFNAEPHSPASCLPSTTTHGTKVSSRCFSSVSLPAADSKASPSGPEAHAEILE